MDITGRDAPLMRTLAGVRRTLAGFAASTARMEVGLPGMRSLYALLGTGGAISYAVKQAGDLEKAWSLVRKTTGLTTPEMAKLRAELEKMSTTMAGVNLDDLTNIAAMAGRLGIQGTAGITEFTRSIAMIRIAMDDIPAEEAATSIARILNVFKMGPDAALSFASALNKLDDSSTATGREILDVTRRISGVASTLGISAQKVLALSSVMKGAGIENEVAGSSISRVLMEMATHTEGFARVAGVSSDKFTKAFKEDALGALKLFLGGLSKLDKMSQLKALKSLKLHGVESATSLLKLNLVIGQLDPAIATANSEWDSHASILKEVEIQGGTTWAQMDRLGNNVRLVAGDLGSLLLPALKEGADEMGALALSVRNNFGSIQEALTPAIAGIQDGIQTAGAVFRNFGSVVGLAVLDAAEYLTVGESYAEHFGNSFRAVFEYIRNNGMGIGKTLAAAFIDPLQQIVQAVMGAKAALEKVFRGETITADDFKAMLPNLAQDALGGMPALKLPEMSIDTEGFEAVRKQLRDQMAEAERANMEAKAKAAGLPPGAVGKPGETKEGEGTLPETSKRKAEFSDLSSYAKRLQEGAFGKDDTGKQTAHWTELTAKAAQELLRAQKGDKPNPGFAV